MHVYVLCNVYEPIQHHNTIEALGVEVFRPDKRPESKYCLNYAIQRLGLS